MLLLFNYSSLNSFVILYLNIKKKDKEILTIYVILIIKKSYKIIIYISVLFFLFPSNRNYNIYIY